jgi:hypothetical protein
MIKKVHTTLLFIALFSFSTSAFSQTSIVDVNKVKTVSGIIDLLKKDSADSNCVIRGFNLMVYPKKGDIYEIKIVGKKAPAELKKIAESLKPEDILVFTNVLMQCNNQCETYAVNDKKIVLK